jgi:RNA polymerase sigma factor (sigma-70 family)
VRYIPNSPEERQEMLEFVGVKSAVELFDSVPPDIILRAPLKTPDPLSEMARTETIESVRQAVLALPAHYREVVVLCELHEMSYAEASQVLGCAVGTVRSRLHRARGLLVERLGALRAEAEKEPESFSRARCFA